MAGNSGAGVLAIAVQDVNHARREACFLDQGGKVENTERRLLCGLHDDGIAASQGWTELPCCH